MLGPAASRLRNPCWAVGMLVVALSFLSGDQVLGKTKTQPPVVRWAEGQPGCTFARGDDGKYRWGLWSNDLGVTLAVDSQELQETRHRIGHLLGVELTYRYRGSGPLAVRNDNLSLQFVRHRQITHTPSIPTNAPGALKSDADTLTVHS